MDNKKVILSLNGIRFVMIMTIFTVHLFSVIEYFEDIISFTNATFAVDYFFILSGFGMMLSNIRKNPSNENNINLKESIRFGFLHVRKIYPLYFSLTILIFSVRIIEDILKNSTRNTYIMHSLYFMTNIPLLQSLTGSKRFIIAFNGSAWFLSTLFIIYFFCPVLIKAIRTVSQSIIHDILGTVLCIAFAIFTSYYFDMLATKIGFIDIGRSTSIALDCLAYSHPIYRVFYVMAGMFIAKISYSLRSKDFFPKHITLLETLVSLLFLVNYFFWKKYPCPWIHSLAEFLFSCLLIFVFSFDSGKISDFFARKSLQHLGNISMYLFLIHMPVMQLVLSYSVDESNIPVTFIQVILILALSFSLSFLSDRLIKKFFR